MNINEAFPSKYLKASDIEEGGRNAIISGVEEEEVGRDKEVRPVLYLEGEDKGIILNKTNATNIAKLYGPETEEWIGKKVVVGTAWVDFQGQSTEGIRIYPPKRTSGQQARPQQRPSVNAPLEREGASGREFAPRGGDMDEEIPFAPEFR